MSTRKLLVIGATGQQGGAVIDALLQNQSNFEIYGLTRNLTSASSKALTARGIKMVQGTTTQLQPVFDNIGPSVWGMFAVTVRGKREEVEGKYLVDAALANKVEYFMLTSADRGGLVRSERDPTTVPHSIAKYNVEKHLIAKAGTREKNMQWTILRPVAFMDNIGPDMVGKITARIMEQMGKRHLQMISTKDIGRTAAYVFNNPDSHHGKAITLAAERLTYEEMNAIFRQEIGHDCPMAPSMLLGFCYEV